MTNWRIWRYDKREYIGKKWEYTLIGFRSRNCGLHGLRRRGLWAFATEGGNLKATREFVLREIAGEHILIPVGETAQKLHGMLNLSESGLLLWNTLQEERTEEELVEALLEE